MRIISKTKAVAAVATLALCSVVMLPGCGGTQQPSAPATGGEQEEQPQVDPVHSSAESIAAEVTESFAPVVDAGFSSDAVNEWMGGILDLMPPDLIDAALEESGMSRSEFSDYMGDMFSSSGVESLGPVLEYMDMDIVFSVGEAMDASDIDEINDLLDDAGVGSEVSSGYKLSMEITAMLLEDMGGMAAGESQTQSQDESGFAAIEIDGAWYVWMG